MFNRKSSFVPAAFILISSLGVSAANAQSTACSYTNASLQGNYAIVANYGSNFAGALGSEHLDGNGIMTRTSLINEPTPGSTTGARTIVTTTQTRPHRSSLHQGEAHRSLSAKPVAPGVEGARREPPFLTELLHRQSAALLRGEPLAPLLAFSHRPLFADSFGHETTMQP